MEFGIHLEFVAKSRASLTDDGGGISQYGRAASSLLSKLLSCGENPPEAINPVLSEGSGL